MIEHKSISIATQIFEKLEKDILSGAYSRGEILTETRLSKDLGVSRTPIREALRRLHQENIIEMTTKGACVLGISKEYIKDIYEIRLRIEGLAARWAAQNADEEGIMELKKIVDLQEFYTLKHDADSIKDMDSAFHCMIYTLSKSKALYDSLEPMHKKIIKYRKTSLSEVTRAEQSYEEHLAIYNAIAKHDCDLAEKLLVEHISKAKKKIEMGGDIDGINNSTKDN